MPCADERERNSMLKIRARLLSGAVAARTGELSEGGTKKKNAG